MKATQGQPIQRGEPMQAYQGAAPTPTRTVSIGDRTADGTAIAEDAGLFPVGPPDLTAPPPLPRGMRSSAPPADAETAAAVVELRQQVGQLTQAIGQMRTDNEAKLEEASLNHQAQLLALRGRVLPTLPDGVKADQTITVGDLTGILTNFGNDFEAGMMRRTWDITPEEEQAALQSNPAIAQLTEPEKTILTKRAVEIRRRAARGTPASTTTSSTAANGSQAAPAPPNSRPIADRVVPMTEATSPGDVGELQPQNVYQQAMVAYREADKIPDRTRRLAAKKAAYKQAQYALGITDEQMAKQPFSQVG